MIEVWNKWVLELEHREKRWDRNVVNREIEFEACRLSTRSCKCYRKIVEETNNWADFGWTGYFLCLYHNQNSNIY